MRSFLIFAILVGLGGLYLSQKHNDQKPATDSTSATTSQSTIKPTATVSEHDWMKRSLDRATEVRNDARRRTQEAQDP